MNRHGSLVLAQQVEIWIRRERERERFKRQKEEEDEDEALMVETDCL